MTMFFVWLFLGINMLVRLPIRIATRGFNIKSEKLGTIDFISTLAAGYCFLGICISGLIESEIEIELAVVGIALMGGICLLLTGVYVYVNIRDKKNQIKK